MFEEFKDHDIAAYAGYISNDKELLECNSGGIATALSRKMIQMGGYVAGVSYSDDFYKAEYRIVNDEKQLERLKGSKYIDADKGTVYKDVKQLLDEGKPVLFFGLPCIVAAMRKFLEKDYDNFIAVDLMCHGPTLPEVHRQFIEHLEKKYNSKVVEFVSRKKFKKWQPLYIYARFDNGKTYKKQFAKTAYGYAFRVLGKQACYSCKFRGNNRTGDIMLGDFWGADKEDVFWNEKGVSSILVHTQKGDQFLKSSNEIKLFESDFERIVSRNRVVVRPRIPHERKEIFEKYYNQKKDIFYATKKSTDFKTKVKKLRTMMIDALPGSVRKYLVKRKQS